MGINLSASFAPNSNCITGIYALTGSYTTGISGAYANPVYSGAIASTGPIGNGIMPNSAEQLPEPVPPKKISKRIKIPWKMYKFVDIKGDKKKSLANATVIAESIQRWWNSVQNWNHSNGIEVKGLKDVYITYMNLIVDSIPVEIEGKPLEKIGILPIATFNDQSNYEINNYDFVLSGIMKVSKTVPDEIVSVIIDGIDVIAGKYQLV